MSDGIIILHAQAGRRMAKLHRADGRCEDYDSSYRYNAQVVPVAGLPDVLDLLRWLLPRPSRCVVRGAAIGPVKGIRRLVHACKKTGDEPTLRDVPRRWLAVDWDGIGRPDDIDATDLAACGAVALATMPEAFTRAACIIQASANHGVKPGCRLRGWFWCERPMTRRELIRWLVATPCDPSVWRADQPIFTAAPLFAPGRIDPIPNRLLVLPGDAELACPSTDALADPPPLPPMPPERIARGRHASMYVERALSRAADAVINAGEGRRHATIIAESRSLGRLVQAGLLSEKDLSAVLVRAAAHAGKTDPKEIASCISWGLTNPSAGRLPETRDAA